MKRGLAAKIRGAQLTSGPWRPIAKRGLSIAFLCVVSLLLYRYGREVEWSAVWTALREYEPFTVIVAALLAAASHLLYTAHDLIARHVVRHGLPPGRVMAVAWISYVFNLNFGALVGGMGFRFRLYSRLGLDAVQIARVYALSVLSNWLGYLLLAGIAFRASERLLPPDWALAPQGLRALGVALTSLGMIYVVVCTIASRRRWRTLRVNLPSDRVAVLQGALSATNWAVMALILFVLLGQRIAYETVLGVLLMAAVAGAVSHVPAGLGVLETTFVVLLGNRLATHDLLACLLTYRALYYVAPLPVALMLYVAMEARIRSALKYSVA